MAKKLDKNLYSELRARGLRKRAARGASKAVAEMDGKGQPPKALREAVDDLKAAVRQLESRVEASDRSAAGRKGARTRSKGAASRSASARKAARTRSKGSAERSATARKAARTRRTRQRVGARTPSASSESGSTTGRGRTGGGSTRSAATRSAATRPGARRS